jgi:hypothetical protein
MTTFTTQDRQDAQQKWDTEVAIGLDGVNATVTINDTNFNVVIGECFKRWINDPVMAYRDDKTIAPLGTLHKEWLHKKLDEWIERAHGIGDQRDALNEELRTYDGKQP